MSADGMKCENRGPAFWATVALVAALVGYPLSIGPAHGIACWLDSPVVWRSSHVAYRPIALICSSDVAARAVFWYAELWVWRRPRLGGGFILPPGFQIDFEYARPGRQP
jgi:hypothetical protein